jgi:hypothetical protein
VNHPTDKHETVTHSLRYTSVAKQELASFSLTTRSLVDATLKNLENDPPPKESDLYEMTTMQAMSGAHVLVSVVPQVESPGLAVFWIYGTTTYEIEILMIRPMVPSSEGTFQQPPTVRN